MTSLPPKIDQRTYEEIVQQTEALVEEYTKEIEGGWKPPGAIEVEPKPELLSGLILNQNISIKVEATVDDLKGRILNEDIKDNKNNNIFKKGTLLKEDQARKIEEQINGNKNDDKSVEILLAARNTLIDATLAQQISRIEGLQQVKVKVETDAGQALIRIFARMVKSVSDRLNQVPEKNFLAFLDLIGGQLKPPQPAKVPLTFYLAEGSPTDGLAPAQTQVSAPPAEGSNEEIVFETDGELVVTTAQLQAVFVREPRQDRYSERTLEATGKKDAPFFAFEGDRVIEHSLYISCPEIFALPELPELKLIFYTDNTNNFQSLPLNWSYWDGSKWQNIPNPRSNSEANQTTITFKNLPIPTNYEINGKTAKWLQAKLTGIYPTRSERLNLPQITNIQSSITINQSNLIPEVCLFNSTPLDLSKDFYPFGEQPKLNDTFYIALHDTFIKPNTDITIDIELSNKSIHKDNLEITWEIGNGQQWQEIAEKKSEEVSWTNNPKLDFTEPESKAILKLKFPEKANIPSPSTVNGETRYWIRARITKGHYGKADSERQYAVYEELAILTQKVTTNTNEEIKEIKVDSIDLLKKEDKIRLFPNTEGFPEEHQITAIDKNDKKLTLEGKIINEGLAVGTRVMRKSIITEKIPATYDPPTVKSLKLSYTFNLEEDAIYLADNDFHYYKPKSFTTKLKSEAAQNHISLNLESVEGLMVGEFLAIESANYQIKTINSAKNEVILTSPISQEYPNNTIVNYDFRPFTPTVDKNPTLYLGFDKSFDNKTVTLYAQVEPPLLEEFSTDIKTETSLKNTANEAGTKIIRTTQPKLVWEYSSSQGWETLGVQDETQAFSQRGLIKFIAPEDFNKIETFGKQLYWLRVRWENGTFRVKPRLRRILTNTIWAVQATTITKEVLGSSNSEPNQVFVANNSPILMEQQLEVQEGKNEEDVWKLWHEVANFYCSNAGERHYTLDRQTGEIRFGDGLAGMIPPRGRNNIRLSYRTGGGKQGNITSETVSQLKTTIPYIDKVINLEAAAGGAEHETLDNLKKRVPKKLRHRDRAVTIEDFEDLAYEASTDVARVKVVTPDLMIPEYSVVEPKFWLDPNISNDDDVLEKIKNRAGQVRIIILPHSSEHQPVPSLALLERVETYIRSRCEATVDLVVTAPKWQEIIVTATIAPVSLDGADIMITKVKERLKRFLHPLTGRIGEGWEFGRYPQISEYYAIIQSIDGVDHVNDLKVEPDPNQELDANSLIYSGNHVVNLTKYDFTTT